jgi:hypothetical protein
VILFQILHSLTCADAHGAFRRSLARKVFLALLKLAIVGGQSRPSCTAGPVVGGSPDEPAQISRETFLGTGNNRLWNEGVLVSSGADF